MERDGGMEARGGDGEALMEKHEGMEEWSTGD